MFKLNLKQKIKTAIKTAIFEGFQDKLESLKMKASSQERKIYRTNSSQQHH